jgi:hypothetical protein
VAHRVPWRADPDGRPAARMTMPAWGRVAKRCPAPLPGLNRAGAPLRQSLPGALRARQAEPVVPFQPSYPPPARWAAALGPRAESGQACGGPVSHR